MANHATLKRPISELVAEVRSGKLSAVELVRASLARIDETHDYNAVLEVNPQAIRDAEAADKRIAAGEDLPLGGIPFIAKDNYLTAGTHTTAASNILKPYEAIYEGAAIQRLGRRAILVESQSGCLAHGSSTENSDFGLPNPVDPTRARNWQLGWAVVSASLLCHGPIPAALSGCQPLLGWWGFPTTLVPRSGVVAMGSSFDTIGPLTNSVVDTAIVMDVLAGRDATDATSIERDAESYAVPAASLKGLKIGVVKEYLGEGLDPEIKQQLLDLVDALKAAGADVQQVSIPNIERALAAYYILVPAEVSSNLARHDGVRYGYSSPDATNLEETYLRSREEGFGAEAKRRIMIGTYVLSSGYYDAYYKRAQKVRTLITQEFDKVLAQYDILVGPTAPTPAFKIGAKVDDPLAMYLNDIMTVAANLAGVPAFGY
jgi:aspartyl-tRNA(Asn)/glutamyl-tRNA(Gln) amidotransferase subunit A